MSQSTSLTLQVGVYRDRLTLEQSTLTLINIKRLVSSRINDKFPDHGISGLVDRLILFRFVIYLFIFNSLNVMTSDMITPPPTSCRWSALAVISTMAA